jgi:hypothetical protein
MTEISYLFYHDSVHLFICVMSILLGFLPQSYDHVERITSY